MSANDDQQLIDLIKREQSGFRFILFAGLFMLVLLVAVSAALGVYYYRTADDMTALLDRQAFETRRSNDRQDNSIAAQDSRLRRIQVEIRGGASGRFNGVITPELRTRALAAARRYLERGRLSFADEQLIEAIATTPDAPADENHGALRAFFNGVMGIVQFQNIGRPAETGDALPSSLQTARAEFYRSAHDPQLASAAQMGLAFVRFQDALRTGYAREECDRLFEAVRASATEGRIGPQQLWWRAQCRRKLGQTEEALLDYAQSLQQSAADARNPAADNADLTLAMNAYHGVGTTLIALPDADAGAIGNALETAADACAESPEVSGSQRMQLAERCLREAIALRRRLGQTSNQESGTAENLSFAYLRDGDFERAFKHAEDIQETGMFAWTELVRVLAADNLAEENQATTRDSAREARRRISFFSVREFNLCELRVLLSPALYEQSVTIIRREHPRGDVECEASAPGSSPAAAL